MFKLYWQWQEKILQSFEKYMERTVEMNHNSFSVIGQLRKDFLCKYMQFKTY